MKKKVLFLLAAAAAVTIAATAVWWLSLQGWAGSPHGGDGRQVSVIVPRGAGPRKVASLLAEAGVIDESDTGRFVFYLRHVARAAGRIKAGELAFRTDMSPRQAIDVLVKGTPVTYEITIPEGLRIDEIAELYQKAGLARYEEFVKKCRDAKFVRSLGVPADSLEGFLFPDTYRFRKDTPAEELIKTMVGRFNKVFDDRWRKRAKERGMTLLEVVTMASIVEKETGAPQERPLIAGVFYNRLEAGWKLQTDPTVIYAVLLSRGSFDGNLTRRDLMIDNPYNTYRYPGLPPGPICNPGREALHAALWPAKTKYFFFVSRNDGTHEFCEDLACHNRAVAKYQLRRRKRSGG